MVPNSVSYCRAKPFKVSAAAPRPGCDGSMLDHSYDESSGLCTLHTGTPVLTEACFFYSSADGIIDEANCAASPARVPERGLINRTNRYAYGRAVSKSGKKKGNGCHFWPQPWRWCLRTWGHSPREDKWED